MISKNKNNRIPNSHCLQEPLIWRKKVVLLPLQKPLICWNKEFPLRFNNYFRQTPWPSSSSSPAKSLHSSLAHDVYRNVVSLRRHWNTRTLFIRIELIKDVPDETRRTKPRRRRKEPRRKNQTPTKDPVMAQRFLQMNLSINKIQRNDQELLCRKPLRRPEEEENTRRSAWEHSEAEKLYSVYHHRRAPNHSVNHHRRTQIYAANPLPENTQAPPARGGRRRPSAEPLSKP